MAMLTAVHERADREDWSTEKMLAVMEDTVLHYNQTSNNGYDPYDATMKYIETCGKFKELK